MLLLFIKDRQGVFSPPFLPFAAFIFRSKRKAVQQGKLSSGLQSHLVLEEQGSHIHIFFRFTLNSLNVLSFHIFKIFSLFLRLLFVLCITFFAFLLFLVFRNSAWKDYPIPLHKLWHIQLSVFVSSLENKRWRNTNQGNIGVDLSKILLLNLLQYLRVNYASASPSRCLSVPSLKTSRTSLFQT